MCDHKIYACLLGDCATWAIDEPGSFTIRDNLGRHWYCLGPIDPKKELPLAIRIKAEVSAMQMIAAQNGFACCGTMFCLFHLEDADSLSEFLSNEDPEFLYES